MGMGAPRGLETGRGAGEWALRLRVVRQSPLAELPRCLGWHGLRAGCPQSTEHRATAPRSDFQLPADRGPRLGRSAGRLACVQQRNVE